HSTQGERRMNSIRVRLTLALVLTALAAAAAMGLLAYRNALHKNEALLDYQLSQMARLLRDQGIVLDPQAGREYEVQDLVVQIWTDDGSMLYLSHPGNPWFDRAMLGFSDVDAKGRRW